MGGAADLENSAGISEESIKGACSQDRYESEAVDLFLGKASGQPLRGPGRRQPKLKISTAERNILENASLWMLLFLVSASSELQGY